MKVVAVVQARMGSTRLPGKVLKDVDGIPLIQLLLTRLSAARRVDEIVVATTENPQDLPLRELVEGLGFATTAGSERDVLDRYIGAARATGADIVVRITGDCPLVDPVLVDEVIDTFLAREVDYASNSYPPTYPDGLDVEVMTIAALEEAGVEATEAFDREHVTPYVRRNARTSTVVGSGGDYSDLRWTVDDPEDLVVVRAVVEHFSPRRDFGWREVLALQSEQPQLFVHNAGAVRNAGATMGTGQKLWNRAKAVIPGGSMLLSKRAEMFAPEQWPAYFDRAQGISVWDLDGAEYLDCSLMGVGTNTLGYGHPEVDAAVVEAISKGTMSTLNAPEEVYLAERLIELHPWADMARFTRSGGEANAVAIRIARAATGKDNVAICGYHGWHDWYLSTNLAGDDQLGGHLLPGLEPAGVPKALRGTTLPFEYNNFEQLLDLVDNHDIGVIKMEVSRNVGPQDGFLQRVRDLATQRGIVLIFDECTSGFRQTFGGLHLMYGVEPDMAVFGKTLGNGYAINAVIGRREVMEAAQGTFVSSTFWTERIGPVAAVRTLEVMERVRSWEQITETGNAVRLGWQALADKHALTIEHWGIPALAGFTVQSPNALAYKTLITQEMLKRGYLASNSLYSSIQHTPEVLEKFFETLDPVFGLIAEVEDGRSLDELLEGPIAHAGFKRLN